MVKLKILIDPNPILRKRSVTVEPTDKDIKREIKSMLEVLRSLPGYGLAAPQVGISKRVVIIENPPEYDENGVVKNHPLPLLILINPEITKYSADKGSFEEGCFSVPQYRGDVVRPLKIRLTALNDMGKRVQINASGLLSRVLQHEIDHLNGILFTDLITDKSKLIKNEIGPEWKEAIEG